MLTSVTRSKLCLILAALVLSGCIVQLAYNRLDWLLMHKLEKLVELDDRQKPLMKVAFDEFHAWHRSTQLPVYIAFIAALRQQLASELTPASWQTFTDDAQLLAERSRRQLLGDAVALIATLSDAQVSELMDSLEEKRLEQKEDVLDLSAEERIERRAKDMRKYLDRWLGRLNKAQKQQIEQWAESLEPFEDGLYLSQLDWERRLAAALERRTDTAALAAAIDQLTEVGSTNLPPELDALIDRNQLKTYALFSDLINNATAAQKRHLDKRLEGYQDDFANLLTKAEVTAPDTELQQSLMLLKPL